MNDTEKMRAAILANITPDVRTGAEIVLDKLVPLSNVEAQIKELEDLAKNTTYNGSYVKERFMELQTRKIELEEK